MMDMKEKAIAICDETEPEVEALKSVLVVLFFVCILLFGLDL